MSVIFIRLVPLMSSSKPFAIVTHQEYLSYTLSTLFVRKIVIFQQTTITFRRKKCEWVKSGGELTNFCSYNRASTAANEISRQWAVRLSTAHRLEFRRALYLHYSNNKMVSRLGWWELRFFELCAPKISACYTTSLSAIRWISNYQQVGTSGA